MTIDCFAEVLHFLSLKDSSREKENWLYFALPTTELPIQLFLVYICVTLGSLDGLNRFSCYLIEDGHGGYVFTFVAKEGIPDAIGTPFAANSVQNSLNESFDSPESVRNTFTRDNSLWRDRRRGLSLQNSRDCDEITRQFLKIDFNESMILSETDISIRNTDIQSVEIALQD